MRRALRHDPVPAHTVPLRPSTRLLWVFPLLVLAVAIVVGLESGRALIATVGGPGPFLVSMLIGGPLAEEPGWRGTAYPRLRASLSRFRAGLLLGVAWAVWHLPLFFIPGTVQNALGLLGWSGLLFTLSVIPMALLTGYAYGRAGVAAAVAVHFGINTTVALLGTPSPVTQAFTVAVQVVVAVGLLSRRSDR